MCNHVANVISKACEDLVFGEKLLRTVIEIICRHLNERPERTFRFSHAFAEVPGPTGNTNFRAEFFRSDWAQIRGDLALLDSGCWNSEPRMFVAYLPGGRFDVSANVATQEVLVVFW
jgi:hypothetical protein